MSIAPDDASEDSTGDLFKEPEDFYAPEKPPTFAHYLSRTGQTVVLRLVGHNPLWGHLLWNAGQVVATYLEDNADSLVNDRNILELGAGAALPSLICAMRGASAVVATDYPDAELIDNIRYNIDHSIPNTSSCKIVAEGFLWGNVVTPLKAHLLPNTDGFDTLILADILFNHSEHEKLISTVQQSLRKDANARCLVFFTPYRPWLLEKDLHFFELAKRGGLLVEKLFEHRMDKVMFPDDRGDENLRKTVFAYQLKWPI